MKNLLSKIIILSAFIALFISCSSSDSPAPTPVDIKPTISSFSPQSAGLGSTITITGTNFSTTAANNVVTINGVTATVTAATATQLSVTVPACSGTGDVKVTVGSTTATAASQFTFVSANQAPTTTITINSIDTDTDTPGDFITTDTDGLTLLATLSAALKTGETVQYSNNNGLSWSALPTTAFAGTAITYTDSFLSNTTAASMDFIVQFKVYNQYGSGAVATQKITVKPAIKILTVNHADSNLTNFSFRTYWVDAQNLPSGSLTGVVILAHGDGGTFEDATLNAQCVEIAKKGIIAIVTSYRPGNNANWVLNVKQFQQDMETLITEAATRGIIPTTMPRNRIILGGLSKGANNSLLMTIQGGLSDGNGTTLAPTTGIGGLILECAGGDNYSGSMLGFPALYMANEIDNGYGNVKISDFSAGLATNGLSNVKSKTKILSIPGTNHCGGADQYTNFIVSNLSILLP